MEDSQTVNTIHELYISYTWQVTKWLHTYTNNGAKFLVTMTKTFYCTGALTVYRTLDLATIQSGSATKVNK